MNVSRKHRISFIVVGVASIAAVFTAIACSDSTGTAKTVVGPGLAVGAGTAQSYVTTLNNVPVEIGLKFSETALTGLPTTLPFSEFLLALPSGASVTPFDHITMNWNPQGHPGMGYGVPHFDFHFYEITVADRAAIGPSDPQFQAKVALAPSSELVPTGYVADPNGVPNMGRHWTDAAAPEKNGQPFTATFVYGSYNGSFTFMEPMVAKSFLDSHPNATAEIKQPARYAKPGYYPTSYKITYDAGAKEYTISLGGFVHRS